MSTESEWSRLTDDDCYLFNEGTHRRLYDKLGAHPVTAAGVTGTTFAVWAPNATAVAVIGDFNGWDPGAHPLARRGSTGIWQGFLPAVGPGAVYKYRIEAPNHVVDKADPFARATEVPPRTGSVVTAFDHHWRDDAWMATRARRHAIDAPIAVYEVHLGSWWRPGPGEFAGYRELAPRLADHVHRLGFTHVELLPVMEHPFGGSWGYQTTGYFAPTARHGPPTDLMALVDELHRHEIGVVFDWVPSHFPTDEHGLAYFDGTHLFEHADPRQGFHPDWNSFIFNYERNEVRSFLLSSAHFWLDHYHADGLRVDAVASMLYLDYSRDEGEWIPNEHGGRENLGALRFLRELNESVYADFPDVHTVAEESTSWPGVSRPTHLGGLGFGYKWDMGWMHDTLGYLARDPMHRSWHHHELTFRAIYQSSENFVLPLSHDEVVHGKGSLIGKMPGDAWQQRANLRLLLGLMIGQPGKKLLFMGVETATHDEWDHDGSLAWDRLDDPDAAGVARFLADANRLYRTHPALHQWDCDPAGFEWIEANDAEHSVVAWLRRARDGTEVLVVANATPVPRHQYRLGVPRDGFWDEILNSDATVYGGTGMGNLGRVETTPVPNHGRYHSVVLTLPPLAVLVLEWSAPAVIPPRTQEPTAEP